MKQDAIIINTARGGIINEQDLYEVMQSEHLSGAAIDVFELEPPSDLEFLKLPNLIPTPHLSGNSYEAVLAMGRSSIKHI